MEPLTEQLKLLHHLMACKDLQALLNAGRRLYQHPLILCDLTYKVIAITEEPELDHAPWKEITAMGGIPLSHTREPATIECYRRSMELGRAQVELSPQGAPPMLRRALCSGSKVIGYLNSPCYKNAAFTEEDGVLFDVIADLCALRMEREHNYVQAPEDMLSFFVSDLLEGRITDERLIEERFRFFHWNLRPPLCIVTLQCLVQGDWPSDLLLQSLCQQTKEFFPLSTVFVYGKQIKVLMPAAGMSALEHANRKALTNSLKKENLAAGVSRPFERVGDLAAFNLQSEKALELGLTFRPGQPLNFYDDLSVFHVLELCGAQTDIMALCHSAIYILGEYDRLHESNLLETMEVYLRCHMSIPEAANQLSIHRNTMGYRINRINELVEIDLNDSETVFHLLLSFHVLEFYSATVARDQEEQRKRKPKRP